MSKRGSFILPLPNDHLFGPARSSNESCYFDRHIAFGLTVSDVKVVNPGCVEHLRVEGIRSKG
jgi:hypothetical protein